MREIDPADGAAPEIDLVDVRKRYGSVVAVDDVSLTLRTGEIHALVGPNGAGKTTLLRTVLGLTPPTAGAVSVPEGVTLGCAFQRPSFYGSLTVAENLDVFGSFVDADASWVAALTDRLGLDVARSRMADDLSGGFSRKLDLALAAANEPTFLLLDEPLGDLDHVTQRRLRGFLADYRDAGGGVVVSTHDLGAFGDAVDRVTVVTDGRVLATAEDPSDPVGFYREATGSR